MEKNYTFEVEKFKEALESTTTLQIKEVEKLSEYGIIYVLFKDSNISHIKVPIVYEGKNNCINIYHSESTKNGFWWDDKINYQKLVKELVQYQ